MQKSIQFAAGVCLNRRTVLRGAGVALGLPWLSAMQPAFAKPQTAPKRFVAMTLGLGLHSENLVPQKSGSTYEPSLYLKSLQDIRNRFSVISGTSHPGVTGGHRAEASILTASQLGSSGRSRNSISIDQLLAKHLGEATRFPSLVLSAGGSNSPAYTENGAMVPAEDSPSALFNRLFVDDSDEERRLQAERVRGGRSIMDMVADDARALSRELGSGDRDRLDAYYTSVRDLEKRMAESQRWSLLPKPSVDQTPPRDIADPDDLIARQKTMHDVMRLAIKTDSTRFITFHTGGAGGVVPVEGVHEGYHALSHHGLDEEKLAQLALVESAMLNQWGDFLRDLRSTDDGEASLLDNTTVLLTSNLGNASNHSNRNMPVLLAGGNFQHGQHLAFDQDNNYPLPNLFVSLLQEMGLAVDRFASSTGTMSGLA
ncbi:MAG: DUF1552 domain-containing protein [Pirellulaceae bacterium]